MLESESYSVREHLRGPVNHPHKEIYAQMRRNVRRQLPQVRPFPGPAPYDVVMMCGGPSVAEFKSTILRKRAAGAKLITVNGTHELALDWGLVPSMHVQMDARPLNAGFVQRPQPTCRYMIASQCHGSVFDAVKGQDVWIWHGGAPSAVEQKILNDYYDKRWVSVPGGSTVGPRAICLAYMLGVRKMDVYGLDGCLMNGAHHAYPQPQNDFETVHVVKIGRRHFRMHPWMTLAFDEWLQLGAYWPDDLHLTVHGDGAIAYVTRLAATQQRAPKMEVIRVE